MRFGCSLLLAVVVAAAACGRGGRNSSPDSNQVPQNVQPYLDKWSAQLVKSCTASDVFSDNNSMTEKFIDLDILAKKLENGDYVAHELGFLILGPATIPSDEATSKFDYSVSINDRPGQAFSSSTERKRGDCIVKVSDQEVGRARLASALSIQADFAGAKEFTVRAHSELNSLNGVTTVINSGLDQVVAELTKPAVESQKRLATKLGLDPANTDLSLFSLSQLDDRLLTYVGGTVNRANGPHVGDKIGSILTQPGQHNVKFLVPSAAEQTAAKIWAFEVTINRQVESGLSKLSAPNTTVQPAEEKSHAAAYSCAATRLGHLTGLDLRSPFLPARSDVLEACRALTTSMTAGFADDANLRELLVSRFRGHHGADSNDYAGWQLELLDVGDLIVSRGQRISDVLGTEAPIIVGFSNHSASFIQGMTETLTPLRRDFVTTAANWSLYNQPTDSQLISDTLALGQKLVPSLTHTYRSFVQSLRYPETQRETLRYGLEHADQLVERGKTLRELGAGFAEAWVDAKLDKLLQLKPDAATFDTWTGALKAGRAFAERDRATVQENDLFRYKIDLKELLAVSLEQNWQEADYAIAEGISPMAKLHRICDSRSGTAGVTVCAGLDLYSRQKFLNPQFADRYKVAAGVFKQSLDQLGEADFSLSNSIENAFFEPVWLRCANDAFATKVARLEQLVRDFVSQESDWLRQNETRRTIQSHLDDCD